MMNRLILDIGGTFIKYAYMDNRFRRVGNFPVIDANGKEDVPAAISKFIENYPIDEIGVSAPAPFDFTNGIGHLIHKLESLNDISLRELFLKRFPKAKITFIHDAVAFMLGAFVENPHLQKEKVACVMLGTGLGYAYSENGRIAVDKNEVTKPELGFQKYKDGIIEDYVSATGLLNLAKKIGYHFNYVKDMADASKNNPKLLAIFNEVGKMLGEVLNAQQKKDPFSMVVIGGGVSKAWPLMKKGFESVSKIKYEIIKDSTECPINGVILAMKLGKDKIYL